MAPLLICLKIYHYDETSVMSELDPELWNSVSLFFPSSYERHVEVI